MLNFIHAQQLAVKQTI